VRTWLQTLTVAVIALVVLSAQRGADDWTFVAGKYAVEASDCKYIAKGQPFSKQWTKAIGAEVLTREGITSPRETHCRFKSSAKGADGKWKVRAQCEEMGAPSPDLEDVIVSKIDDSSIEVLAEDTFGPEPLAFKPCPR